VRQVGHDDAPCAGGRQRDAALPDAAAELDDGAEAGEAPARVGRRLPSFLYEPVPDDPVGRHEAGLPEDEADVGVLGGAAPVGAPGLGRPLVRVVVAAAFAGAPCHGRFALDHD